MTGLSFQVRMFIHMSKNSVALWLSLVCLVQCLVQCLWLSLAALTALSPIDSAQRACMRSPNTPNTPNTLVSHVSTPGDAKSQMRRPGGGGPHPPDPIGQIRHVSTPGDAKSQMRHPVPFPLVVFSAVFSLVQMRRPVT